MFCFQCEQTSQGTGCTNFGVCGKDPETATLQDLLIYALKGISMYAHRAALLGARDRKINKFTVEGLFTTITNVNFDPESIWRMIYTAEKTLEKSKQLYINACETKGVPPENPGGPSAWKAVKGLDQLINQGEQFSIEKSINKNGPDIAGLRELIIIGLKGTAAYADHAGILGLEKDEIYDSFHRILNFLAEEPEDVGVLLKTALEVGELNLKTMELLDTANTHSYGNPEPTQVRITPVKGKAILVSGHDLKDLEELLKQTADTGINVYTHGEMLPCNAYPGLKKYPHLKGNYGGAWQDQRKEFDIFPGSILMTTNCIQKPKDSYKNRIFTSGLVQWPGVVHIKDRNFKPVIDAALKAEGFPEDTPEKYITTGFAHDALSKASGKVIEALKTGRIRHIFLIGGCDGAKSGRNYYTKLAEQVPDDCVILTLACGKYRFNKLEFGDIDGIPRLLDAGQCNDAYSAVKTASALASAFNSGINDLPLSMILSWYEQKAVSILLTLLFLGVRGMRLGPSLPAFLSPNVVDILVQKFDIKPITTPEEDLKAILG